MFICFNDELRQSEPRVGVVNKLKMPEYRWISMILNDRKKCNSARDLLLLFGDCSRRDDKF